MANPQGSGYAGQLGISSSVGDYNKHYFLVQRALGRVRTNQIVQVVAADSNGQVAPAGFLNVTILINQIDGIGNASPHGTIYQVPYLRLQGGTNAVIMDPQVGDIGWAGFADRDISAVVRSRISSAFSSLGNVVNRFNPGSRRKFDPADGVWIGGMLNGTPTQYVAFSPAGISVVSPNAITMAAPTITLTAPTITMDAATSITMTSPTVTINASTKVELNTPDTQIDGDLTSGGGSSTATFNGSLVATGEITGNGIDLSIHVHPGVTSGGSNTGTPTG